MSSLFPLHYYTNFGAAISVAPLLLGINAVFSPQAGLEMLGFPRPTQPQQAQLVDGVIKLYGARDVTVGLANLALWWTGNTAGLGWSLLAGTIMVAVDGYVTQKILGHGGMKHWPLVPVLGGLGLVLVGVV